MQWKTEPAGLFITRDRLAANAAFSPRTRSGNTERAYWLLHQLPLGARAFFDVVIVFLIDFFCQLLYVDSIQRYVIT